MLHFTRCDVHLRKCHQAGDDVAKMFAICPWSILQVVPNLNCRGNQSNAAYRGGGTIAGEIKIYWLNMARMSRNWWCHDSTWSFAQELPILNTTFQAWVANELILFLEEKTTHPFEDSVQINKSQRWISLQIWLPDSEHLVANLILLCMLGC